MEGGIDRSLEYSSEASQGRLAYLFRALHSRNYRLFFSGQMVSLIGTWLTITATSWLVYRLTQNARTLGLVNFCGQIPAFVLSPFAGVMVDRWRRLYLLKWTQFLSMLESFGLAGVAFVTARYGHDVPHHVAMMSMAALCGLAAFQGLVNAFDVPARQALVVRLVARPEDLGNAIALNSSLFNLARFLGPLMAGFLIYLLGEGWCFTLDGVSYCAVLLALMMMRLEDKPRAKVERRVMHEFHDGLKYAAGFHAVRTILIALGVLSFASIAQSVLLPVFAVKILHGNAVTQALLMAAGAVGSLAAAIRLAARKSVVGLGREIAISAGVLGGGMIVYGLSNHLWLSLAALCVSGFAGMTQMAAGNTLLQTLVDEEMRGRLMSLFTMAFMGMMPLGSLAAGALADTRVGAQWTTAAGGGVCLMVSMGFFIALPRIRRELRPIYIKRGIIPETAAAIQATEGVLEEGERTS
jgi:MFS family permease